MMHADHDVGLQLSFLQAVVLVQSGTYIILLVHFLVFFFQWLHKWLDFYAPNFAKQSWPTMCSPFLRCIKDWISTVLVLTWVACNISGKENAMGIWCNIQSHPTRARPLPHPKSCPHIFNTFISAKRTNRVADLQEQLFSLFFLDSSKYHCPQQVSRSEDDRLRESFPEMAKIVSKNTHVHKRFLFFYSVLLHCQSSDRPFIAACAVVHSSV